MKILVIKPSSLGDVIHALPFLKTVKDTFPDAQVDWVISKTLKGILEENPLIHELIIFNKDAWKNVKRLPKTVSEISALKRTLKSRHYDMAVDLQGLLRSGLISFFTPATTKIGFGDAREGSRYFYDIEVPVNDNMHAVDKCLAIAKKMGAKFRKTTFPLHVSTTAKNRIKKLLGDKREYIVIVPSARWLSKRWPAENFASVIGKTSTPCVIAGSRGDKDIARKIIEVRAQSKKQRAKTTGNKLIDPEERDNIIDLCGKTDLKGLTALIAGAKAVLSNDSGPLHIAAALNIPTVAIFGPTNPEKTGPYGWQKKKNLHVVRSDVPCSPCRRKNCKDITCMKKITTAAVYKALKNYL
jgi:lipopolysaccharide heptosyltransferase I